MTTRPLRLLAGLSAIALVVFAASPAGAARSPVRVPQIASELNRAYAQLHRAGLRVTIARPFTLRSDALTVVRSITPKAGARVARGTVVTLTVLCCRRPRHPKGAHTPVAVPNLVGHSLATASSFAGHKGRRFTATLGALRAGGASQLLLDYRVSRQSPGGGHTLTGTQRLVVAARQGTAAPCTPPIFATPVVHDAVAVVSALTSQTITANGEIGPGAVYYGCTYKTGRQRRLTASYVTANHDFSLLTPALSGTELAAATATGSGKYGTAPENYAIETYDLLTGRAAKVYDAGVDRLDEVAVNAAGFTAWHQITLPSSTSTSFTDVSCPNANMCVATDRSGSVFTTTSPSRGRGAWSQTQLVGASTLSGVSCASPTLCVAVSGSDVWVSSNPAGGAGAWTETAIPGASLQRVSCRSASLCVAVGGNGVATSSNSASGVWSFGPVTGANGLFGVSCPGTTLCVASDSTGNVVSSTNPAGGSATWSVANVDGTQSPSDVSCASSSFCIATDFSGDVLTSTNPAGGLPAWALSHVANTGLTRISCPSPSLCVAGSYSGVASSTNPAGGAGAWSFFQIPGGTAIRGMSCPTTSLCVAVNQSGEITTSSNPTVGSSAWGAATVDAPACAASSGCATEQILAHDGAGTRSLDSTGPGSGKQLQGLTLTGDQLTWTHDGTAESATLG